MVPLCSDLKHTNTTIRFHLRAGGVKAPWSARDQAHAWLGFVKAQRQTAGRGEACSSKWVSDVLAIMGGHNHAFFECFRIVFALVTKVEPFVHSFPRVADGDTGKTLLLIGTGDIDCARQKLCDIILHVASEITAVRVTGGGGTIGRVSVNSTQQARIENDQIQSHKASGFALSRIVLQNDQMDVVRRVEKPAAAVGEIAEQQEGLSSANSVDDAVDEGGGDDGDVSLQLVEERERRRRLAFELEKTQVVESRSRTARAKTHKMKMAFHFKNTAMLNADTMQLRQLSLLGAAAEDEQLDEQDDDQCSRAQA